MTYDEIKATIMDLQSQADALWKEERHVALGRARALVAEFKLKPIELFPKQHKVPIKYTDGTHTWSGRGKTPKWLEGKDKDYYLV